jgi:hypothetical protein
MDHSEQNPKIQTKRHFTGGGVAETNQEKEEKMLARSERSRMSWKRQGRQREMHYFRGEDNRKCHSKRPRNLQEAASC